MKHKHPLVSIIALCYNQADFVAQAVESVMNQSYPNIELIVVNDASTDFSKDVIDELCRVYPQISFIHHEQNLGMCRSFNNALKVAQGDFIIDLACDDYFELDKIERQIKAFEGLDKSWGVVFTDAYMVGQDGTVQNTFYKRDKQGRVSQSIISGDVFSKVVRQYQICSPTIMVRREVFDDINGYDPNLRYEDYDFFIRVSRNYKLYFLDYISTRKRVVKSSDSNGFYSHKENPHLQSTLIVLKKYLWLSRSEEEKKSALHSIRYHMRQALFMECYSLVEGYFELIELFNKVKVSDRLILFLSRKRIPLFRLYSCYRKMRFG
jgi:glycosyltransferase involved in cell wall biosynthesis